MKNNAHIAVIGAGIIGLTSALTLLKNGISVAIFHDKSLIPTSSSVAYAFWWPHKTKAEEKVKSWALRTYKHYNDLSKIKNSGVSFKEFLRFCIDEDESLYALELFSDWQKLDGIQHGVECKEAYSMKLPFINTKIFIDYLKGEIENKGGEFKNQKISSLEELSSFKRIVNCSGLGSRELFMDNSVYPIRGQTIHIAKSKTSTDKLRIYKRKDSFSTIIPTDDSIMLAGVAQENDSSLEPRELDSIDILSRCSSFDPSIANSKVQNTNVGLRPARPSIRLEKECLSNGQEIIHNYGHGGSGFTLCWGCSEDVVSLI